VVNQVQEPDEGDDCLDDAEQARTEQVGVGAFDANGLKNLQRISQ
jgi:hypothetical protein